MLIRAHFYTSYFMNGAKLWIFYAFIIDGELNTYKKACLLEGGEVKKLKDIQNMTSPK